MNDQTSQSGGFGKTLAERHRERLSGVSRKDFRFGSINAFLLVTIFIVGLVAHVFVYSASSQAVWTALGTAMALVVLLWLIQVWEGVVVMCVATCLAIYLELRPESGVFIATTIVALLLAPTIQMALQWERAVVLRVGKFRGLRGPGIFMMLPLIDKVAQYVDQRVRVTDFNAETTLTADTVPVSVDAIGFWMVWDPEKAVLEVEGFEEAVVLSAQTALRNAIGKNDLAVLLSERDRLGQEIQKVLDEKTNTWGITTTAVEIRDIIIPEALEDAMSRQAQAERERQSRVILGTAETEIAEKYAHASRHYQGNQVALHLRAMNMVYEGLRHRGAMVIVPSSAVETMGLGALGGLTAFGKMNEDQPDLDGGESPATATADHGAIVTSMMNTDASVSIRGLRKSFGDVNAVKDLSLEVHRGEIFGFLGPNGAGKTTTISMVCGLLRPDSGEILVDGTPLAEDYRAARTRMGLCPQEVAIWEMLTCFEQLEFVARQYDLPRRVARLRADELLEVLGLQEKRNRLAKTLSGGMKRRLNIALALVHDPEILILDEPQAGLDPQSRILVREHIRSLAQDKTVILTTHDMDEVDRMAERVAIIDHGELLVLDTPDALKGRVGPGDVLEVRVSAGDGLDAEQLRGSLPESVQNLTYDEDTLRVVALEALELLPHLLERIRKAGAEAHDIQLRKKTLEDVFIALTGRRLRE